jgi:hypothetical protein
MVGGVGVDVLVAETLTRADHERRAELRDALARLVDPVAGLASAPGTREAARVEQAPRARPLHRRGSSGAGVVVDEHREGHVLVGDEASRVPLITGADGDDLGAPPGDLVVVLTQLRSVLPAEQSAEVAQEDQDHRPFRPEVPEPLRLSGRIGEFEVRERAEVHERAQ